MPELFLSKVLPLTVPLVVAAPAGLRWLDCTVVLFTVLAGRLAPVPAETVGPDGLVVDPALLTVPLEGFVSCPAGCLPATALFSLTEGVVLTIEDLEADPALVAVPLVVVTLFGVTLPEEACALVVVLPAAELFLLMVLLVPMPPLVETPLAKTLPDPVSCLEPYHTSFPCPPMWPGP